MKPRTKKAKAQATRPTTVQSLTAQGIRNYERTLRNGQKLQEETARGYSRMLSQAASPPEWQKGIANMTALAGTFMPMAQKRFQEWVALMSENSRASAELIRKAFEAAQTPVPAQSQMRWLDFWTTSMKAMQANAQALTHMGTGMMDSWMKFFVENAHAEPVADVKRG